MMRPQVSEAAPYYFTYINLAPDGEIVDVLARQLEETSSFLSGITEEKSLERYAPGKWSLRELLNHVNDAERVFVFRALWFARGFKEPLPSFDQEVGVKGAGADQISWASLVNEFRSIRLATLAFFESLPAEAWLRSGIASDNPFTVLALAYIIAGHVKHHSNVIRDSYLSTGANQSAG